MHKSLQAQRIPFTKDYFESMKLEQKRLWKELDALKERLQTAREMGDLSENGAYKYAKFEIRDTNRKLRTLKHCLTFGYVPNIVLTNSIGFGHIVKIQIANKEREFQLVSAYESDPHEGKVSIDSPLGSCLYGKTVGSKVSYATESNTIAVNILEVRVPKNS